MPRLLHPNFVWVENALGVIQMNIDFVGIFFLWLILFQRDFHALLTIQWVRYVSHHTLMILSYLKLF